MFSTKIETDIILRHARTNVTYEITNLLDSVQEMVFNFSVVEQPLISDFRMEFHIIKYRPNHFFFSTFLDFVDVLIYWSYSQGKTSNHSLKSEKLTTVELFMKTPAKRVFQQLTFQSHLLSGLSKLNYYYLLL